MTAVDNTTGPAPGGPVDTPAEPENDTTRKAAAAAAIKDKVTAAQKRAGSWKGFVANPMSVQEAWELSWIIDKRRIPDDSNWMYWWWWLSNRSDRVLLFGLLMILPTALNKPVLLMATRPTRRWGMYLVVFLMLVVLPAATAVG